MVREPTVVGVSNNVSNIRGFVDVVAVAEPVQLLILLGFRQRALMVGVVQPLFERCVVFCNPARVRHKLEASFLLLLPFDILLIHNNACRDIVREMTTSTARTYQRW